MAVAIGGQLIPGYSHVYNTVSELTAADAPTLVSVQALFALYNLLLLVFGVGLTQQAVTGKIRISAFMLVGIALCGLAMYFFPQDPRGITMTFNGKMHIVLAGILSPLTMLSMIFFGTGTRKTALEGLRLYSYISCVATLLAGGLSVIGMAQNSPYGGVYERLTIGSFLQWVLVVSITIAVKQVTKTSTQATVAKR